MSAESTVPSAATTSERFEPEIVGDVAVSPPANSARSVVVPTLAPATFDRAVDSVAGNGNAIACVAKRILSTFGEYALAAPRPPPKMMPSETGTAVRPRRADESPTPSAVHV